MNESNPKQYRKSDAITEYKEFPGRSHYTLGQEGWEEVADYALDWAVSHAAKSRWSEARARAETTGRSNHGSRTR